MANVIETAIRHRHRKRIRRLCEERGLVIQPHGAGWRIVGQGVSLTVNDLASVRECDLMPR